MAHYLDVEFLRRTEIDSGQESTMHMDMNKCIFVIVTSQLPTGTCQTD